MSTKHNALILLGLVLFIPVVSWSQVQMPPTAGSVLDSSGTMMSGVYRIETSDLQDLPFLIIEGNDIEIDFNQAVLDGRQGGQLPDTYAGVALYIRNSKNVTIRNVTIRGFHIAILAERVQNLTIESCDVSYNYKPRLYSRWDRESLSDWLYFHQNEQDEWKAYGAGIYLKECDNAEVRNVVCHQGMNGLMMVGCHNGLVYNNDICFNSGVGIGLYRSTGNRIMHNRLDWNARGYSHGQYARGQDSAAILLYEQSSRNTIAFNSGTHSGDGLFLWAGQSTMDTGEGGCDSNLIYRNDFSQGIANGIEATFSANYMIGNILNECRFGVWGGYSHHSVIADNEIRFCEAAIAIEHGRHILIDHNIISDCQTGIWLWDRPSQPPDWAYAQKVDVKGKAYVIRDNTIAGVSRPYTITDTDEMMFSGNKVDQPDTLTASNESDKNNRLLAGRKQIELPDITLPEPLPDGLSTHLPPQTARGLKYILVDEWGPYDFKSPKVALRSVARQAGQETLQFDLLGPSGKWKLDAIRGCDMPDHTTGRFPDSITITCPEDSRIRDIQFTYMGQEVVTPFGDTLKEGTLYPFQYTSATIATDWVVMYFAYDSLTDPILQPSSFDSLLWSTPMATTLTDQLGYRWWGSPAPLIPSDQFAIRAISPVFTEEGDFLLEAESDDGIRVWLDDTMVWERWDIHTPKMDRVPLRLTKGEHMLTVDYFEAGGLGVLDIHLIPQVFPSTR